MTKLFAALCVLSTLAAHATETGSAGQILRYPNSSPAGTRPKYGSIDISNIATVSNTVLSIANGGTGQSTKAPAFDALSPNTNKGDMTIRTVTTNAALAVGTNGQFLTADSTQTLGVKWSTAATGIIPVTSGGTGLTTITANALMTGNGTGNVLPISQLTSKTFLPSVGQQISSSCGGGYSNATSSFTDVSNLTVTITTTGRPVLIVTQGDGSTGQANWTLSQAAVSPGGAVQLLRGATVIELVNMSQLLNGVSSSGTSSWHFPPGVISILDTPGAGTYTYKIQAEGNGAGSATTIFCGNVSLAAFEL